jgi:Icc-related predicted phosphoesterase
MKLFPASDFHLDFHADNGRAFLKSIKPKGKASLALAGDLGEFRSYQIARDWFDQICNNFVQVYFVPGNHEYYNSSPQEVDGICAELEKSFHNLHIKDLFSGVPLGNSGKKIWGDTLWFPMRQDDYLYYRQLNDFCVINDFGSYPFERHYAFCENLFENFREGDVILTHHAPSLRAIAKTYEGSPINRFFANGLGSLTSTIKPSWWIHGHTHQYNEYTEGDCKFVCNPLGYPGEISVHTFKDDMKISV